jgi:hypothetical protein
MELVKRIRIRRLAVWIMQIRGVVRVPKWRKGWQQLALGMFVEFRAATSDLTLFNRHGFLNQAAAP